MVPGAVPEGAIVIVVCTLPEYMVVVTNPRVVVVGIAVVFDVCKMISTVPKTPPEGGIVIVVNTSPEVIVVVI